MIHIIVMDMPAALNSGLLKLLGILILFVIAGAILNELIRKPSVTGDVLRVGIPFQKSLGTLNPSSIATSSEAILLRNLFGSLFEYNDLGQIIPGLVDDYHWRGELLVLSVGQKKVSSGRNLTAEDVILSLKRMIVVGGNLHGDLKEILCPDFKFDDLHADCEGIQVEGSKIVLRPHNDEVRNHLIPLLATVDFRILPKEAVDWNVKGLPLARLDVVTGAYAVSSESAELIRMEVNPHFHHYDELMPRIVEIPKLNFRQAIDAFLAGSLDLLSSAVPVTSLELLDFEQKFPDLEVAKTYNIRIKLLYFSEGAIRDFTDEQRFGIAAKLKKRFDSIPLPFENDTVEFFQEFAAGYLSLAQRESLRALRASKNIYVLDRQVSLGMTSQSLTRWKPFLDNNSEFTPRISDDSFFKVEQQNRPDVFSGVNDVAFDQSSSVLSYNIRMGIFGPFDQKRKTWLRDYLKAKSPHDSEMINELHFEALSKCYLYPLGASPYLVTARNGWKPSMNPYFSTTELWRVKRN